MIPKRIIPLIKEFKHKSIINTVQIITIVKLIISYSICVGTLITHFWNEPIFHAMYFHEKNRC